MKKVKKMLCFSMLLVTGICYQISAQNSDEKINAIPKSARELDIFIEKIKLEKEFNLIEIDSIGKNIIERFSEGIFVSDDAVINFSIILSRIDYTNKDQSIEQPNRLSLDFIDAVLKLLYKRDYLKVKLLERKAFLLTNPAYNSESYKKAKENYQLMLSILEPLYMNNTFVINRSKLELGDILWKMERETEKSEEYYMDIQRFPFWQIRDPKDFNTLRKFYITASKRRMEINSGNLKALEHLLFVPAARHELNPLLKEYIEEAGGDWKEYLESIE